MRADVSGAATIVNVKLVPTFVIAQDSAFETEVQAAASLSAGEGV